MMVHDGGELNLQPAQVRQHQAPPQRVPVRQRHQPVQVRQQPVRQQRQLYSYKFQL